MRLNGLALALGLLLAVPAHATLLTGVTIGVTYLEPDQSTPTFGPQNIVVGPGVELSGIVIDGPGTLSIDADDSSILITTNTDPASFDSFSFNGLRFTDVDNVLPDVSPTIDGTSTLLPVVTENNGLFVNFAGLSYQDGSFVRIDFTAVPEPATIGLFGLGLAALGFAGRRRKG